MKRLTLIRHANADWKNPHVPDFERPLNKRGLSEAEAIGKQLLEHELVPDLLLTSSARRTQETAEIIAGKLDLTARRIKAHETLYLATLDDILSFVHGTGPKVAHLAIVGHNPGISELGKYLAPGVITMDMPTGAACSLTFTARSWTTLHQPAARAVQFQPPSKLFGLFT
jgi:phosphohistidine phosphatase